MKAQKAAQLAEKEAERLSDECYLLENGKIKNI